ncbi:MAG: DUF6161 domain-containing protein, partial [Planctomycetota bacterium]
DGNRNAREFYFQPLTGVISKLNACENQKDAAIVEQYINQAKEILQRYKDRLIPSDSRAGRFILSIAEESPDLAAEVGQAIGGYIQINNNTLQTQHAIALSALFRANQIRDHEIIHHERRLINARLEWSNYFQAAEGSIEQLEATHRNLATQATNKIALLDGRMQEQEAKLDSSMTNLREEMREEYERTRAFYREGLQSKAPLEYWQDRASKHGDAARKFGIAFGVSLFLVLGVICIAFAQVVLPIAGTSMGGESKLWLLGSIAAMLGLVVWPVRIIAKMLVSNLHMETSCTERATIVETYLSLLEQDGNIDAEERKLMLAAVFSPSSDGIVKDDGSTSFFEVMMKSLKN